MALKVFAWLSVVLIALSSGCARYKVRSLVDHDKTIDSYMQEKNKIQLAVYALHEEDLKNYFLPYKVLHVRIKNKTDIPYHLSSDNISLPLESQSHFRRVQPLVYTRDLLPSVVSVFAGVLFWWEICLPLSSILCLLAFQNAGHQNDRTLKKLQHKVLFDGESITISPKSTLSVVVFVPKKEYNVPFDVTLTTNEGSSVTFDVVITSKVVHGYHVV